MKIFEYKPNLGTFSLGFETFDPNEVVEVLGLAPNFDFGYNKTHKQWFLPSFQSIHDYELQKKCDLALLNPFIGENIGRKGKDNFSPNDLDACLSFLKRETPEFAIISMDLNAVPLLNTADDYIRDGFDQVSRDYVIKFLQDCGYDAYLVPIDEANYGIPTHREFAFYVATPNDFDMKVPKGLFTETGRGEYNKFRTIAEAIGDLGTLGEWVPYKSEPQTPYQRRLRRGMERVTWHFLSKKVTKSQKEALKHIKQGSNAKKTKEIRQRAGYNRPKWYEICSKLDHDFYLTSCHSYPSIHPLEDRPFTIREGMRLSGLPDNLSFDLKTPKPEVAKMVSQAIAPAIGELFSVALRSI